jgi:hypothetical protein
MQKKKAEARNAVEQRVVKVKEVTECGCICLCRGGGYSCVYMGECETVH